MTWTGRYQIMKGLEKPPKELGLFLVIYRGVLSWDLPITAHLSPPFSQRLLPSPTSGPSVGNVLINDENHSALQDYKGFLGALRRKKSWLLLSTVPVTPLVTGFLVPSFSISWVCLSQRHSENHITVAWSSSVCRSFQAWNTSETQGIRCVRQRGAGPCGLVHFPCSFLAPSHIVGKNIFFVEEWGALSPLPFIFIYFLFFLHRSFLYFLKNLSLFMTLKICYTPICFLSVIPMKYTNFVQILFWLDFWSIQL